MPRSFFGRICKIAALSLLLAANAQADSARSVRAGRMLHPLYLASY
ncbi:hypothetical protein [Silvimonas soli]|nr:hypothetical protein [Silvimonas soli]